ncbi:MAG: ABC transporter permease, partial [Acidobacteriota bacterium]
MLFRKAVGRLMAAPLFTAFAVLSLAAGVAVTTAVYSVVDKLLLSGIGAPNLDSLAFVMARSNGRTRRAGLSDQDFQELKDSQRTFVQLSASMAFFAPATSNQRTEVAGIEAVDPAYFRTLGLSPRLGRLIEPADEASQARVVVISADFWRNRHGADPAVLGRTIRLSGQPFEVIGVAPDAYDGLGERVLAASAWIPLAS